ncbi:MAG: hypothetical protein PVJ60_03485 [Phycisphaerales bacterium]|jgi:hypothetical protein
MFRDVHIILRHRLFLVLLALILLLSGCTGSSQKIQQGMDLSTSGIQYADAVDGLLNVTINRVIDFDSAEAIKIRKYASEDSLKSIIKERDTALLGLLNELNSFRQYTQQLKVYFLNLQALADSKVQTETGAAVRELGESIHNANNKIRKKKKIKLSKKETDGIAALSQFVAKGVHAAKVDAALRRDANIISEQLLLHEKLLDNLAGMLKDRFKIESDEFLKVKVISPYTNKEIPLGAEWKKDRKKWLKSQFTFESLNKAKEAARQLRAVWEQILQGRSDLNSISSALQDINEFVMVINEIKEANESKGDSR